MASWGVEEFLPNSIFTPNSLGSAGRLPASC